MVDLKKCFFEKGDVLIFSGEAERSGSYGVEAPGSNPIHEYDFLFPYFLCYHKSWDTVSRKFTIMVNSKQINNSG